MLGEARPFILRQAQDEGLWGVRERLFRINRMDLTRSGSPRRFDPIQDPRALAAHIKEAIGVHRDAIEYLRRG